jgi:hypothetical protein
MVNGGAVVVVGSGALVVVARDDDVVDSTASSGAQAVAMTARTSRTATRRFMVDLEMDFRSPSRDRAGTLMV